MPRSFLDTSALVKRYHIETGTPIVDSIFASGDAVQVSRLAVVELTSALALKVRTSEISAGQMSLALQRFHSDVSQGTLQIMRILARHYRDSERLLVSYGTKQQLRTLDALQLAVALDLWTAKQTDQFVCADFAMMDIAKAERLPVVNVMVTPTP
jgi:predicted nucleic acid-binding protein